MTDLIDDEDEYELTINTGFVAAFYETERDSVIAAMKQAYGPEEFKLAVAIMELGREQMLKQGWEDVNGGSSREPPSRRELLVQLFPLAFAGCDKPRQPLAVGIDRQIREAMPEALQCSLSYVLRWYTSKPRYLRALAQPGARRVNLDGSDAGPVSEHDRAGAQARLDHLARQAAAKKERPDRLRFRMMRNQEKVQSPSPKPRRTRFLGLATWPYQPKSQSPRRLRMIGRRKNIPAPRPKAR